MNLSADSRLPTLLKSLLIKPAANTLKLTFVAFKLLWNIPLSPSVSGASNATQLQQQHWQHPCHEKRICGIRKKKRSRVTLKECWLIKCFLNCIFDDTVTITISHDAFNGPIAWCLPWQVNLSVWAKEEVKKFCFTKFCYIGWAMHSIAMHACFAATARSLPWKVNLSAWGRRRGQEHSSFYFSPFHLSVPVCGF